MGEHARLMCGLDNAVQFSSYTWFPLHMHQEVTSTCRQLWIVIKLVFLTIVDSDQISLFDMIIDCEIEANHCN